MIDYTHGKRVMHIDTSHKLYEKHVTGIAYKIVKTKEHRGTALSPKLKKELEKKLDANYDRARIYAIVIYFLIKDKLNLFDDLIICNDEDFQSVKEYLYLLFQGDSDYLKKNVKSISELRVETGDKNLRSYADDIAYSYMKRALRSIARRQKGIPLNVLKITFDMFKEKWMEIERKIKAGGE
ncbi:MAG: hypothetical protein BWY36_00427 [Candidatus Diapherotrites archaeon ADurb.Bin253]|nr:MAG: hypothetical protein BWY36_00427 [Candidatus Diapherotrites archaeon ADurb.Bin253]HNZ52077.1 hypothetical protein [Candidatus Pacearchaeota archaeon]HPX74614.1 hypothetical protein [Candidatus Pacearchaeota archaeon]